MTENGSLLDISPRYEEYDVVVIGSGSAGLTAAKGCAKYGARVLLVEKLNRLGGDCTWFGCVPSKALIRCARAAQDARECAKFGVTGVDPGSVKVDWSKVKQHVKSSQNLIYKKDDSPEVIEEEGVEVLCGVLASFEDSTTINFKSTGGKQGIVRESVKADKVIIATGAGPAIPPIAGLDQVAYLTYETIFDIPSLPNRLIVVGGGPIGCELAQAFARLGSKVTLVGTMLPREDDDVRKIMMKAFMDDGLVCVDGRAKSVQKKGSGILLTTSTGCSVEGDALLVASGRKPKGLEAMELENAGVTYDSNEGIPVNRKYQTSASNIYAVGDCLGGLQFTHLAGMQAGLAAINAVVLPWGGFNIATSDEECPRCTFTHPEVASVGLTESEAKEQYGDTKVEVTIRESIDIDRAVCEGETNGFIKIIHTPAGKILGATVVSPVAGEIASELGLAVAAGTNLETIGKNIHAYPTFSFGLFQSAALFAQNKLWNSSALQCFHRCFAKSLRGAEDE